MTVENAASALARHIRTIWRDVGVLARAGFPIYNDRRWQDTELTPDNVTSAPERA